jgi:hypothetical protein
VAKFPSLAGDDVADHPHFDGRAYLALAHDEAHLRVDVPRPPLARHERERPAPDLRLAHRRFVGPDAATQRPREGRGSKDDDIAPGDRFSRRDARFHVAPHAAGAVDVLARHRDAGGPGVGVGVGGSRGDADESGREGGVGDGAAHRLTPYQTPRVVSA